MIIYSQETIPFPDVLFWPVLKLPMYAGLMLGIPENGVPGGESLYYSLYQKLLFLGMLNNK